MIEFEWTSEETLQGELVAKVTAYSGLFIGPAIALFILDYKFVGAILIFVSILVALLTIFNRSPTKITIQDNALFYGDSHKLDLQTMKQAKVTRQFGLEDVLVVKGSEGSNSIPLRGIPNSVQEELITILNKKIENTANK